MFVEQENNLNETNSQAERTCRKALADAGFGLGISASFHWSQLTNPEGERIAAVNAYQTLLDHEKNSKSALEGLAYLYQLMGHQEHAKYFRRKLKEVEVREYGIAENESPKVVDYLLAKTGEAKMPDRVPLEFISAHFDKYSESFDSSLVKNLAYAGPSLVRKQVESLFPVANNDLQVLDLGCGTGLVGESLVSFSEILVGIDLSVNMLKKAAAKNCYNKLIKSDCVSYLEASRDKFDLITAVDVLNYIGDLSQLFNLTKKNLLENGIFIFTVETANTTDFRLANTGRFQHSGHYIRHLAKTYRYQIVVEHNVELRKERDGIVNAKLYGFKKFGS